LCAFYIFKLFTQEKTATYLFVLSGYAITSAIYGDYTLLPYPKFNFIHTTLLKIVMEPAFNSLYHQFRACLLFTVAFERTYFLYLSF